MGNRTVSLIIPTLNRPLFLKRLLQYLKQQEFPHPILVADSSSEPACSANRKLVDSIADAGLEIEYRPYDPGMYFEHKVANALRVLDSRYSVLCGDDDFIIPRTIDKCVEFLESNIDYETAAGLVSNLYAVEPLAQGRLLAGITPGISQSKLWIKPTTARPPLTIDDRDPCARICAHLLNYHPTTYSVHRRKNHLSSMQTTAAGFGGDYLFGEMMSSVLSVIQGKKKHLDGLYIIRPLHPDDSTSRLVGTQTYSIVEDGFSKRYARFRDSIAQVLVATGGVSPEEARDTINDAFIGFAAQNLIYRKNVQTEKKPTKTGLVQMARHFGRIEQVLRALPRSVLEHRFLGMIRAPRGYAKLLYHEGKWVSTYNYLPFDQLLRRRSQFQGDSQLIYDLLISYESECPLLSVALDVS